MMRKLLYSLAGLAIGYAIGIAVGVAVVSLWSGNTHDKSVETAMTAAFVTGPAGAIIGMIVAWLGGQRTEVKPASRGPAA